MKRIILILNLFCGTLFASNANTTKMREMASIFGQLLPTVLDHPQQLSHDEIYTLLKRLQVIAHDLTHDKEILGRDPSLKYIARKMSFELSLIDPNLLQAESLLTRHVILKSLSYCVACHLQDPERQSQFSSYLGVDPSKWPLRQQARFYAATRNFEQAIIKYEYALKDKAFKKNQPELWLEDLKRLLIIIIRHKKSPSFTKEMASFFIDKSSSQTLKNILIPWRHASDEWGEERVFPKKKADIYAKALALAEKGLNSEKKLKHSGFIYFVRALGFLQKLAKMPPPDKYLSQAFLEAGVVAEQLSPGFDFPIHVSYYEACIRSQPKSTIARKCYKKLQDSSMALLKDKKNIPDLLRIPLEDLRKVSE